MSEKTAAVLDVASDAIDATANTVSSGVKSAEAAVDSTVNAAGDAARSVENAAESGVKSTSHALGNFGANELVTGLPTASDSHEGASNGVLRWLTSAGMPTNGLFLGFAIMSLIAFINFCVSASAGLGWNIFLNLETFVAAAILSANWATPPAYGAISGLMSKIFTNSQIRKWVWFGYNVIQFFFYIGGMANASIGNYCSIYGAYLASVCSKASAILAFDVFLFLGWTLSLILSCLELFKPDLVPWIGWHTDNAAYDTKAAVDLPEQSVV